MKVGTKVILWRKSVHSCFKLCKLDWIYVDDIWLSSLISYGTRKSLLQLFFNRPLFVMPLTRFKCNCLKSFVIVLLFIIVYSSKPKSWVVIHSRHASLLHTFCSSSSSSSLSLWCNIWRTNFRASLQRFIVTWNSSDIEIGNKLPNGLRWLLFLWFFGFFFSGIRMSALYHENIGNRLDERKVGN